MVNPDCLSTWEQSKPTSTGVTSKGALGKRCILHKYMYFIKHCMKCFHNHRTIFGDSPWAILSTAPNDRTLP